MEILNASARGWRSLAKNISFDLIWGNYILAVIKSTVPPKQISFRRSHVSCVCCVVSCCHSGHVVCDVTAAMLVVTSRHHVGCDITATSLVVSDGGHVNWTLIIDSLASIVSEQTRFVHVFKQNCLFLIETWTHICCVHRVRHDIPKANTNRPGKNS